MLDEETLRIRTEAHGSVQGAEFQISAQARTWTENQDAIMQERADEALRRSQQEFEERARAVQASRDALGSQLSATKQDLDLWKIRATEAERRASQVRLHEQLAAEM